MPTTSQITLTDECHSFVSEQSTREPDALRRIPRPPNAFMLYRSDFLKSRVVPPHVEKRQQNLSRIAGQCWNKLSDTEKAIWFGKAAAVRAEHCVKYQSHITGPSRKDERRLPTRDKKRGATNSEHSFGRFRTRQMRTPYCDGMFAALHEPTSPGPSPESQTNLLSPFPASGDPTSTSLFPLLFPHILPPPSVTPDDSVIWRDGFGCSLDLLGSETLQRSPHKNQIATSNRGPSQEMDYTPQRYRHDFASHVPYPDPAQLQRDPLQVPLVFPPAGADSADCRSLLSESTDALAHCNQSFVLLYPQRSNELNTSAQTGF